MLVQSRAIIAFIASHVWWNSKILKKFFVDLIGLSKARIFKKVLKKNIKVFLNGVLDIGVGTLESRASGRHEVKVSRGHR